MVISITITFEIQQDIVFDSYEFPATHIIDLTIPRFSRDSTIIYYSRRMRCVHSISPFHDMKIIGTLKRLLEDNEVWGLRAECSGKELRVLLNGPIEYATRIKSILYSSWDIKGSCRPEEGNEPRSYRPLGAFLSILKKKILEEQRIYLTFDLFIRRGSEASTGLNRIHFGSLQSAEKANRMFHLEIFIWGEHGELSRTLQPSGHLRKKS